MSNEGKHWVIDWIAATRRGGPPQDGEISRWSNIIIWRGLRCRVPLWVLINIGWCDLCSRELTGGPDRQWAGPGATIPPTSCPRPGHAIWNNTSHILQLIQMLDGRSTGKMAICWSTPAHKRDRFGHFRLTSSTLLVYLSGANETWASNFVIICMNT